MKNFKKVIAFILVFLLVSINFNFGVFAASNGTIKATAITLVKPAYSVITLEKGKEM